MTSCTLSGRDSKGLCEPDESHGNLKCLSDTPLCVIDILSRGL